MASPLQERWIFIAEDEALMRSTLATALKRPAPKSRLHIPSGKL
jgi:hypothetical protein